MSRRYDLVVIGASIGGLDALKQVLGCLPQSFRPAVAICQHRRPDGTSRLVHILQAPCALPVVEPEDKTAIEDGVVYLAPADYHLLVERGWLALSTDEPALCARPSIDVLFQTAAEAYQNRTVGVLLTGASADGAAGLFTIAKWGGLTIVQDPDTAVSPVAPSAALARFRPDHVLPLGSIGPELARCCAA